MDNKDQLQYQRYRQSKVRGLDYLPAHWEEERAKHYFQSVDERSETGEEQLLSVSEKRGIEPRDDEKVHMRKAESYEGYKLCQPGDLVINSMWAWKRGLGVSEHSGIISTAYSVFRLRDPSLFEEKYLDWLLRTDLYVGEYLCRSQGVWKSRLTLSDREFLDIPIIRPPIEDQQAIVDHLEDTLDDIDAYVAKKRELVDLLETQRRAVVNRAVTKGLNDDVAMRDSGVEWLGEIPAHWETRKVKYACHVQRGKFSHRPRNDSRFYGGPYPFIQTGDVARAGKYVRDYEQSLNEKGLAVSRLFKKGTLVMAIAANVGDVAMLEFDSCFPDSVVGFRPFDGVSKNYLYYALMAVKSQLERVAVQSAQANLNVERISSMEIALPPHQEQERIANKLDEMDEQIDAAIERTERQIELMQQYRTSLVTEVVTGAVDVRAEMAA